ncbi:CopG family transcriptional regulator [Nostoc sp. FACHB-110]|uniref:CopG family transcriptional regulator n=1 Tax=Nostoc sp. FACHB-110 TaxID=2692834 RepID=UPI0016895F0C|nr:CopG family transcriptional regulator [Nostoc sp. FACHB-110]MBD2441084.1 CopG family transcriptional regulator [Nostoc sp. FACHB-110]
MDKTTAVSPGSIIVTHRQTSQLTQVTLNLTSDEAQILKHYCEKTGKSEQDLIRELIQELPVI